MKLTWEYLVAVAGLIVTVLLAWFLGIWLHLTGTNLWILRIGILALGILAVVAFLMWAYSEKKKAAGAAKPAEQSSEPEAAGATGAPEDVDILIREAESKVGSSRLGKGAKLNALPAIFVLGDTGSGKTTALLHSGLDPELLAGQVFQEGNVAPTPTANVWFARKTVFVEAAGRLSSEPKAWARLVHRLAPSKFQSIFGRKQQAPRAALVCFDCEKFLKPGGADAIIGLAKKLRARLEEMSQQLGSSFPVYCFFNKLDRMPYFDEFVATLSNEEGAQVLGVTLAIATGPSSGVYAEQENKRLSAAFTSLFSSLSDWRPNLLSREHDTGKKASAYEFPRQFRKLGKPAVDFLVELCRPSHLRSGPFLRGFYFTGRRMVAAAAPSPAMMAAQTMMRPAATFSSSATTMMRAEDLQNLGFPQGGTGTIIQGAVETREVPQWTFLTHIFSHVLLQDRGALGASGASTKVNFWRRLLFASAAVVGLILILAFLISFISNRQMESQVASAASALRSTQPASGQLASLDDLRKLDALRQSLQSLYVYERDGAPLHMRWGLYAGHEVFANGRAAYFAAFRQMMFGDTQNSLRQALSQLPATPAPTDDYSNAYAELKAYLITTSNPDKSSRDFLTPVLLKAWAAGHDVDVPRTELAQQQFDFYSDQLKISNPYISQSDSGVVDHARHYLAQFAATQRVYHTMLAAASKANPAINFGRMFPDAAAVVRDPHEVDGAFTKGGYSSMQDAFLHVDRFFSGEEWVLGAQSGAGPDRNGLDQQLRALYEKDYIDQWRGFLNDASFSRYSSVPDAAAKLLKLSGNQSPILVLLCQVSQNTAVGSPNIQQAFQPVQQVVPAACKNQYIQPSNTQYINNLLQLQTCMDQLASTPKEQQDAAKGQCVTAATQAKTTTLQIAQGFRVDQDGHVDHTVQTLMQAPISNAQGTLQAQAPGGEGLCAQFQPLMAKFPFNPRAQQQVNLQEVAAVFAPASGAISKFYQENLTNILVADGTQYSPKPGSPTPVSPAFLGFFNQAARLQSALYPGGATQPQYHYAIRPYASEGIQSLTLSIDGKTYTSSASSPAPLEFVWPGSGQGVTLTAKFAGGSDLTLLHFEGLWAVFDFFGAASSVRPAGAVYHVEWSPTTSGQPMRLANGHPVTLQFDVDTKGAPFIFERGSLSGLRCVSRVSTH